MMKKKEIIMKIICEIELRDFLKKRINFNILPKDKIINFLIFIFVIIYKYKY